MGNVKIKFNKKVADADWFTKPIDARFENIMLKQKKRYFLWVALRFRTSTGYEINEGVESILIDLFIF